MLGEILRLDVRHLEDDLTAAREPRRDQIFDHLLLAVDRDRPAAGQLGEVDAVELAYELGVDAAVDLPLLLQAMIFICRLPSSAENS